MIQRKREINCLKCNFQTLQHIGKVKLCHQAWSQCGKLGEKWMHDGYPSRRRVRCWEPKMASLPNGGWITQSVRANSRCKTDDIYDAHTQQSNLYYFSNHHLLLYLCTYQSLKPYIAAIKQPRNARNCDPRLNLYHFLYLISLPFNDCIRDFDIVEKFLLLVWSLQFNSITTSSFFVLLIWKEKFVNELGSWIHSCKISMDNFHFV